MAKRKYDSNRSAGNLKQNCDYYIPTKSDIVVTARQTYSNLPAKGQLLKSPRRNSHSSFQEVFEDVISPQQLGISLAYYYSLCSGHDSFLTERHDRLRIRR